MHPTYKFPKLYYQLQALDAVLQKDGYSLDDHFGLRLREDSSHYHVTPLDLVPFGDIGVDGIRYGFLTDFRRVQDLEEAFIVLISPMDFGNPHKIVAKNFGEFLNLAWTVKGAMDLANVHYKRTEEDYTSLLKYFEESQDELDNDHKNKQAYVLQRIEDEFGVQPVEDIYDYIENEVKAAREQHIVLSTLDGLGVVGENPKDSPYMKFEVTENEPADLEQLNAFLLESSKESKLALIRDI